MQIAHIAWIMENLSARRLRDSSIVYRIRLPFSSPEAAALVLVSTKRIPAAGQKDRGSWTLGTRMKDDISSPRVRYIGISETFRDNV